MTREEAFNKWLETRPQCVQQLAKEFTIGSHFNVEGKTLYLVGYTENDQLIVSIYNPAENYEEAISTREYICASHFRKAS